MVVALRYQICKESLLQNYLEKLHTLISHLISWSQWELLLLHKMIILLILRILFLTLWNWTYKWKIFSYFEKKSELSNISYRIYTTTMDFQKRVDIMFWGRRMKDDLSLLILWVDSLLGNIETGKSREVGLQNRKVYILEFWLKLGFFKGHRQKDTRKVVLRYKGEPL